MLIFFNVVALHRAIFIPATISAIPLPPAGRALIINRRITHCRRVLLHLVSVDLPQSVRRFTARKLRPQPARPTDGDQRGRSRRDWRQGVFRGQGTFRGGIFSAGASTVDGRRGRSTRWRFWKIWIL